MEAQDLTDNPDSDISYPDSPTDKPKRKAPRSAFVRGYDPRRNLIGRPKKGESMPELLKRAIERPKVTRLVVAAAVERLVRTDAVGNRAFADVRDTVYGIPKQTLVLEQADSPLLAFLMRQAQVDPSLIVEGEVRQLPATTD